MFCPCCKQELIGTEPFCPGCGTYIDSDMIVKTEAEQRSLHEYAEFFCLSVLAAFILTYLLGTNFILLLIALVFLRLGRSRLAAVLLGGFAGAALGYVFMLLI